MIPRRGSIGPNSYRIQRQGARRCRPWPRREELSAHSLGRRAGLRYRQDLIQLSGVYGLLDLEALDHGVHLEALLGEDSLRGLVGLLDEAADLLVDELGHLFRKVPLLTQVPPQEHQLLLLAHRDG